MTRERISEASLKQIDARRICLIKPSALGDVVQTLPLLPVLKERFPQAEISWVIHHGLRELLEGHPQIDHLISYHRHGSWRGCWQLFGELRSRKFDMVLDLQGLLRTGLMTWATASPLRIGLESSREGAGYACHFLLRDTGRFVPAHLRYWRVAEALGLANRTRETHIAISRNDDDWAAQILQTNGSPILAVNPGARWATKRWPIEHFAAIAAKAARHFGFSIVILGGSDETVLASQLEHLLTRFVRNARVENLAGKTSLKQLAAVLRHSDVVLTNDSGPMHLAAGLGTPVLGIFTCTDPVRSGPPGDRHELVTTQLSCANCYKKQCRYRGRKKMACLEEITVERVWQRFAALVTRHAQQPKAA
ncbi:MAG: lipopolysaccharide heptosyltransferase I [Planctomycetaceae bacterium]